MCCCGQPTINGELGYRWQPTDSPSVRPINAPELGENETLLYDEPGRCGGLDSHCHHYRVVKAHGMMSLLVRHGGGDERVSFGGCDRTMLAPLTALDSNGRYWLLNALYHATTDARHKAHNLEAAKWRKAAAEKRIKTRKQRGGTGVKVWIESVAYARPGAT